MAPWSLQKLNGVKLHGKKIMVIEFHSLIHGYGIIVDFHFIKQFTCDQLTTSPLCNTMKTVLTVT